MKRRIPLLILICALLVSALCPTAMAKSADTLHGLTIERQLVRVYNDDYEYMEYTPTNFGAHGSMGHIDADLDHDGADERLEVIMSGDRVYMTVYESTADGWSPMDNAELYEVYLNCNIMASDVFLKEIDGKWMIFNEMWYQENAIADGASWTFKSFVYDGVSLTQDADLWLDGTDVSGSLYEWANEPDWAEYRPELKDIAKQLMTYDFAIDSVYWQNMICEQDFAPFVVCRLMSVQDVPYDTVFDFYTYGGESLGGFRSMIVDCSISSHQLPEEYFLSNNQPPEEANNFEQMIIDEANPADEYIIPDSDVRELTREELSAYDKDTLALIRNEILARYGYPFQKQKYRDYFESKSWYTRNEGFTYGMLTSLEMENIELIKKLEQ